MILRELAEKFELSPISNDHLFDRKIVTSDLNRPGIELMGFLENHDPNRIQIFGNKEHNFITTNINENDLTNFLEKDMAAIVYCQGNEPPHFFIEKAEKFKIPILKTPQVTTVISGKLNRALMLSLSPETSLHGVFVSIYGQGVIIQGVSGIGKSEIALELISRGHILVADDRVDLRRIDEEIIGTTVPLLHGKLEVRGVGIVDIKKLFGSISVLNKKKLKCIVEIVDDKIETFDRIGNNLTHEDILGVKVIKMRLPLRVGRNYATIIETAVAQIKIFQTEGNTGEHFIAELNKQLLEGSNERS